MISQKTIDAVHGLGIEEVISKFVKLRKRGANYQGLCPFHDEKTPSFVVSPSKGIYKCFGCSKSGDHITFIKEHGRLSYPEAIEALCGQFNIDFVEDDLDDAQKEFRRRQAEILEVLKEAEKMFAKALPGSEAHQILATRGITEQSISKFGIGLSSGLVARLSSVFKTRYPEQTLVDAGLSVKTTEGAIHDFFRARIVFSLHNQNGKVVGFAGRSLRDQKPKYINTPDTPVFKKRNELYGLYFAKQEIIRSGKAYLVEGYTDVISMHQAAIENTVAACGTSFAETQARVLRTPASPSPLSNRSLARSTCATTTRFY